MDGSSSGFKIEKLSDSNYHVWKQKIELVLAFRELSDHLESRPVPTNNADLSIWLKNDAKAKAIIGLSLSDEHLEHVRDVETAYGMWVAIQNIFQRRTLLNRLNARRKFYSLKMGPDERIIPYINRAKQLCTDLKAMDAVVTDQELAMTVLCGLPSKYEHLIVAIDAVADDEKLTLEFVKSRLIQEEQRIMERSQSSDRNNDLALIGRTDGRGSTRQIPVCSHCKRRGHVEPKCWQKYPHLKPGQKSLVSDAQPSSEQVQSSSDEESFVCLLAGENNGCSQWVIDSGATSHMCYQRELFVDLEEIPPYNIKMGDSSNVKGNGKGTVNIQILVHNKPVSCTLKNVLFVPMLSYNLLSVSVMARAGLKVVFENKSCSVIQNEKCIAQGSLRDMHYYLNTTVAAPVSDSSVALFAGLNRWHERLGHVHTEAIQNMFRHQVVEGLQIDPKKVTDKCVSCILGKSSRLPIPKINENRSKRVLALVHSDVCMQPESSMGGSKYFVSFIDDYSRYCWVYPIKEKSSVFETFKKWLVMVERQLELKLQVLRSDNGGEYVSSEMNRFLEERGILHQKTAPYNPHQNGVAERLNRTLGDLIRSMLHHKQLPNVFWAEALMVAAYIRNRVTSRGISSLTTPFELLFGQKPNLSHIRVFGCRCWITNRGSNLSKLDARATEAILIGYARGSKGYKLWDPVRRSVIVSRDVRFDEDSSHDQHSSNTDLYDNPGELNMENLLDKSEEPICNKKAEKIDENNSPIPSASSAHDMAIDQTTDEPVAVRRSSRQRQQTTSWWRGNQALISTLQSEPKTYTEAVRSSDQEQWKFAMEQEIASLDLHKTWKLVPRPQNENVVGCKWIYKVKEEQREGGSLGTRFKARLVAKGYSQVEGVDYSETFAPVVKFTSIRIILAMVATFDLHLHQMDVVTAFLYGKLQEDVYMEQPEGFISDENQDKVCHLSKALYGLKQAPREWNKVIDKFFSEELGMTRNTADACVYMKRENGHVTLVALYVDDLLIASSNMNVLLDTKHKLQTSFKMKDLGESKMILGIEIFRDRPRKSLFICQDRYVRRVLERFGMQSANGSSTPMDQNLDLQQNSESCKMPYREAIGCLLYLSVGTRPDISFAVARLAKYVEHPTMLHWTCVKRIFRYLAGTQGMGLEYNGMTEVCPTVYVDADWASDTETRKSVSGMVTIMSGAAVAWYSRQQEVVALSTTEAEYISLCSGTKETVWTRRLICDIGLVPSIEFPTPLLTDNQGGIGLVSNESVNRRTKHIDVRYHYTRNAVNASEIKIEYCCTEDMAADVMTKPLGRIKMKKFSEMCGLRYNKGCKSM